MTADSDNDVSAPSTPAGSVTSQVAADTSVTTIGSIDEPGSEGYSTRRDSDAAANSSQGEAESEKHPKGKRKRTAAKDKVILEEAYKNDPKPDKRARLDIVARVSMNEKEVQIWFQNRRQNDRRKSRPLSPQEIAALRSGSMQIISTDPFYATYGPGTGHVSPAHLSIAMSHDHRGPPRPASGRDSFSGRGGSFSSTPGYLANRWNLGSSFESSAAAAESVDEPSDADSLAAEVSPRTVTAPFQPGNYHPMRLSMSLDGKAELIPRGEPSPIRFPPPARSLSAATLPSLNLPRPDAPALQRSHSAAAAPLPGITLPPLSALTSSLPASTPAMFVLPSLSRGRSRDAHAWLLCADDADTRDDLTAHAENEASGSALAPISLLRSTGNVLQPSGSRRNAAAGRPPLLRPQGVKKPKLGGRSASSIARMQSHAPREDEKPARESDKVDSSKIKVSMLLSGGGDSDKENWSPDEDGNPRPPVQPRPRRPVPATSFLDRDHDRPLSGGNINHSGSPRRLPRILPDPFDGKLPPPTRRNSVPPLRALLGKRPGDDSSRLDIFEDGSDGESDGRRVRRRRSNDEVELFMRGEVSPSKRGDFDCVTGLLSLSRGNWR